MFSPLSHCTLTYAVLGILLGSLTLGGGIFFAGSTFASREAVSFVEFAQRSREQGLYLHSGSGEPEIRECHFFVAEYPLEIEQVSQLVMAKCGQIPAWKGVVFVLDLEGKRPTSVCVWGHQRVVGNLLLAGDPELMDRLEQLYRQ